MTPEEDEEVIFVKRQKIIPSRPSDDGRTNLVPIETQNSSSSSSSSSSSKTSSQNLHFECFVCGTELHQFDEQSKEFHLNQCLDKFEQNSEGIRSENYGCMLCGLSLRGKALIIRCQHIKRCSKIYGIGIRELLHMIAPEKYEELFTQIDHSTQLVQETHLAQKPNANDILMANARLKWNPQSLAPSNSTPTLPQSRNRTSMTRTQSEPKRGRENSNTEIRDYAPEYKKVIFPPMTTPIIVDGFTYASPTLSDCYILTHFHSDHYSGLSRTFEYGTIYCSSVTCSLVRTKLGVKGQYLRSLDLEKKHTILCNGYPVEIIFTEANHCPGAVCVLFNFPNGKRVYHTGDFRWTNELLLSSATLQNLAQSTSNPRDLVVYLDTTYCDPQYTFPPQITTAVIDCVREELKIASTLFVFGAYGIGKEKMYMSVAEEFNMKVYVDDSRWKTMLAYGWPISTTKRLTKDPEASWLWVAPMGSLTFDSLTTLKRDKPGCQRVVAFQPTGWSHTSSSTSLEIGIIKPKRKDGNVIYSVPYSEHSSYSELVDFIRTFRPHRVIPTVNTSKEKVQEQLRALRVSVAELDNPSRSCSHGLQSSRLEQVSLHNYVSEFR